MSTESFGQDPYPYGAPLTEGESQVFAEVRREFVEGDRARCVLADETPGTVLRMNTLVGVATFAIHSWGTGHEIVPGTAVYAKTVENHIREISTSEFKIFGASEERTMLNLGTIDECADLMVAPLTVGPLWEEDMAMSEEEFQIQVAHGAIIYTQMGYLRRVEREPVVIPGVVSLERVVRKKGDEAATFFPRLP